MVRWSTRTRTATPSCPCEKPAPASDAELPFIQVEYEGFVVRIRHCVESEGKDQETTARSVQPNTARQNANNHVVFQQRSAISAALAAESPVQSTQSTNAKYAHWQHSPNVVVAVDGDPKQAAGGHNVGAGLDGDGAVVSRRANGLRSSCDGQDAVRRNRAQRKILTPISELFDCKYQRVGDATNEVTANQNSPAGS